MKLQTSNIRNEFVGLKNQDWLDKQRIAGKVVANTLALLEDLVKERTTKSLIELDNIAKEFIITNDCIPTFLNYKGFPNSVCISVNKQLVHGIPTNYKLQDGDVVSFDLGATYMGAIGDAAITCIYGEPKSKTHVKGIETANKCLVNAISAISIGKRIGVIGDAIYKTAHSNGFNIIEQYGGHGLSWNKPHDAPFIANKSNQNKGIRIQSGMTIAIEPLLIPANCLTTTKIGSDGWTVYTEDISYHAELSIFVHEDHVEIMTRH